MRRALVASVLTTAGCDQGARDNTDRISVPPQVAPPRDRELVPPQVAPPDDPIPPQAYQDDVPPQAYRMPPQVAHAPIPPQVAWASGFSVEVLGPDRKPLVRRKVTITVGDKTYSAMTDDRGEVNLAFPLDSDVRFTVRAAGYAPAHATAPYGEHPHARVVLRKQKPKTAP